MKHALCLITQSTYERVSIRLSYLMNFSSAINNLYEIEIFDCSGNHYDSIQLINRNQTENYMMNIGTNHGVYVVALKSNGVIIDTYKLIK